MTDKTMTLKDRMESLIPLLEDGRKTHVEWRDWLISDPKNEKRNPDCGDAEFHAVMVKEYDERLSCIRDAIDFITRHISHTAERGEAVAWLVLDEEGSPSMLFFDRVEALAYCDDDEQPTPLYTAPPLAAGVPDAKPLPDLMMASYHEAIGWNACRTAMLSSPHDPSSPGETK